MTIKLDIDEKDLVTLLKLVKQVFKGEETELLTKIRKEVAAYEEEISQPPPPPLVPDDAPVIKECLFCNAAFEQKRKTQVFCSAACRVKYNLQKKAESSPPKPKKEPKPPKVKETLPERTCDCCGQKFTPGRKNQRFCCFECSKNYNTWYNGMAKSGVPLSQYLADHDFKGGLGKRKCIQCGKEFVATTPEQKYCSKECKLERNKVRQAESDGKRLCMVCSMPFHPVDPAQKFCDKCLQCFGEDDCNAMLVNREELLKVRKERKNEELCHHKVCPRCARDFYDPTNTMFFCPKCTAKAQNQPKIKPLEEDKQ